MEKENQLNEEQHLHFRKGHSETFNHLLIKLLAYCYFWDRKERFLIEPNYRHRGYKPDLLTLVSSDIPARLEKEVGIWVECKTVTIKKLIKLAKTLPHSQIYWFHTESTFRGLLKSLKQKEKLSSHKNLHLIGLRMDKQTYNFLAGELGQQQPTWILQRVENTLQISNGMWKRQIEFIRPIMK